ncbi:hypothetical protein FAM09_23310 [Niastella caeni]|uniref:Uncharacterized protein n=1 Tax=Niastella caeni TaxID=2569763 RepID=A0A4S8HIP2_9BACT|nr:hypothetical protein [Niastella caeni]THU34923.1 hypothetical protein FAM09_23310 [Niastella caeni]
MKRWFFISIAFMSVLLCQGQQVKMRSWGVEISPAKYYKVTYQPSDIYFPALGTVAIVNNTNRFMFRSNVDLFFLTIKKRTMIEYGLGLQSEEYNMNEDAIGQAYYFSQQAIMVSNYSLRPHVHIGYIVSDNRSVHILVKAGLFYSLITFKQDYNYFNKLLKATFRDEIIVNLLGEPVLVDLHDRFYFLKTTFSCGIQFRRHRVLLDILYDFQNRNLEIFRSDKPILIKQCQQFRLQLGFLFGNKYVQK